VNAIVVGDGGADHDEIVDYRRRRRHLVLLKLERRVAEAAPQIDDAGVTEIGDRAAGRGVERDETRIDGSEDDAVAPRADAACSEVTEPGGGAHLSVVSPQLTAGDGVERKNLSERGADEHPPV
jgi:hypothetical protein